MKPIDTALLILGYIGLLILFPSFFWQVFRNKFVDDEKIRKEENIAEIISKGNPPNRVLKDSVQPFDRISWYLIGIGLIAVVLGFNLAKTSG